MCSRLFFLKQARLSYLSIILGFLISLPSNPWADNYRSSKLLIKKVEFDIINHIKDGYNYTKTKDIFPNYSYLGLPSEILIKPQPDLSVEPNDIVKIIIFNYPSTSSGYLYFNVRFIFSANLSAVLKEYSSKNIGKHIALEIDGEIFVIPKILTIIENDFDITMASKNFDNVKKILSKVSELEIRGTPFTFDS